MPVFSMDSHKQMSWLLLAGNMIEWEFPSYPQTSGVGDDSKLHKNKLEMVGTEAASSRVNRHVS